MIKFTLVCSNGHEFQSWFKSGEAFDAQAKAGLVACPLCQTVEVAKAIMAPAIAGRRGAGGEEQGPPAEDQSQAKGALLDRRDNEARAMISAFRDRVFALAEDVGTRFAEEARKIHNGLVPQRAIHGQATFDDARALVEEGVAVLPVPPLPDERN
jgi:hypothetical protein